MRNLIPTYTKLSPEWKFVFIMRCTKCIYLPLVLLFFFPFRKWPSESVSQGQPPENEGIFWYDSLDYFSFFHFVADKRWSNSWATVWSAPRNQFLAIHVRLSCLRSILLTIQELANIDSKILPYWKCERSLLFSYRVKWWNNSQYKIAY